MQNTQQTEAKAGRARLASYGWLIDRELMDGRDIFLLGPLHIADEITDRLKAGEGQRFRIYDDDGVAYYEGRYIGPDDGHLFAPLDDYGMPSVGCTTIAYRAADGSDRWEIL